MYLYSWTFFRNLLGGTAPTVTHGTVKPWKHTTMGLWFASLTGSKLATCRFWTELDTVISYSETKGLETEFQAAGFMSKHIKDQDPLPLHRICYMDPISRSTTNNDAVEETMIRTMSVAKETGQGYAVVTYDLAVALKAYSIQAIETPLFDKMMIMLSHFPPKWHFTEQLVHS